MAAERRPSPGVRMGDLNKIADALYSDQKKDTNEALTALAGGGQTGAIALNTGFNELTSVASIADSVQLPAAIAGSAVTLINSGGNASTVYGKEGRTDTIDGTAGATGVSQADGANALYVCVTTGAWHKITGA